MPGRADTVGLSLPGQSRPCTYGKQDDHVGPSSGQTRFVDPPDPVDTQSPTRSLVGEGRVDGTVAHHPGPPLQSRAHNFGHQLRSIRSEHESLGPRGNRGPVEQHVAERLAQKGPTRLPYRYDLDANRLQTRPQARLEAGLPGPSMPSTAM